MKRIKLFIFLVVFTANMFVPLYSDWFYGALSLFDCRECANILHANLYKNSSKYFFDFISHLYFYYTVSSIATLYVLLSFISTLLLYLHYSSYTKSGEDNSNQGLVFLCSVLSLGVMFYGQDLHPALFLIPLLFTQLYVQTKIRSSDNILIFLGFCILSILAHHVVRFVDLRADLVSSFAIIFCFCTCERKIRTKDLVFVLVFVLSVFLTKTYMVSSLVGLPLFGALQSGLSYDFAFFLILVFIFAFLNTPPKPNIVVYTIVVILIVASLYSYVMKVLCAYTLSYLIMNSKVNAEFKKLEAALGLMSAKLKMLSSEGVIFLLVSIYFVSVVSYFSNPISDYIYPKRSIDSLLEKKECPVSFSKNMIGYLSYRYSHDLQCLKAIEKQLAEKKNVTTCLNMNATNTLSALNYCKLPDIWR